MLPQELKDEGETKPKKIFTLVFILKNDEILLGLKKRGLGEGFWNGFGGKVEAGESIVAAATREVYEECRLQVKVEDLEEVAVINFDVTGFKEVMELNVFKTSKYDGVEVESEEMAPKWWEVTKIPFEQMWPDSRIWYPFLLGGKTKFWGDFKIDKIESNYKVMEYNIWGDETRKCLLSTLKSLP